MMYELGQKVAIRISGEKGEIAARCESSDCFDQYKVRYKGADGRAMESWLFESEIQQVKVVRRRS